MHITAWKRAFARVAGTTVACAVGLALTGCTTESGPAMFSDRLYLDTSREPCGHRGRPVEIFQKPPSRPYTRVAYVEAFAAFYAKDEITWEMLRSSLCRQASEADADAIIELTVGSRPYSRLVQIMGVEVSGGGETKKLTGIAIRYDDPSP